MAPHTIGAIALKLTGNKQGGWFYLSLNTGRRINHLHATELPMPANVIDHVHRLAQTNPKGLIFWDCHDNLILDNKNNMNDNPEQNYKYNNNDTFSTSSNDTLSINSSDSKSNHDDDKNHTYNVLVDTRSPSPNHNNNDNIEDSGCLTGVDRNNNKNNHNNTEHDEPTKDNVPITNNSCTKDNGTNNNKPHQTT